MKKNQANFFFGFSCSYQNVICNEFHCGFLPYNFFPIVSKLVKKKSQKAEISFNIHAAACLNLTRIREKNEVAQKTLLSFLYLTRE